MLLKFVGTLFFSLAEGSPFETWDLYNHRALSRRRTKIPLRRATGSDQKQGLSYFCPWFRDSYVFPSGGKTPYNGLHVEHIRPEDSRLQASISAVLSKATLLCVSSCLDGSVCVSSGFNGHTSIAGILLCRLPCWWIKHSLNLQRMRWVGGWLKFGARKGKSQDVMFNSMCQLGSCFWMRLNIQSADSKWRDYSPRCGWDSSNQLKAWIEWKDQPPWSKRKFRDCSGFICPSASGISRLPL